MIFGDGGCLTLMCLGGIVVFFGMGTLFVFGTGLLSNSGDGIGINAGLLIAGEGF